MAVNGGWVKEPEKKEILQISADLINEDPKIPMSRIADIVQRDDQTVKKIIEKDKKFSKYLEDSKKKLIQTKLAALKLGNNQIVDALNKGKMDPYKIIGMDSRFWDQVYGATDKSNSNNTQVNVQITRGDVDKTTSEAE